jgi:hypothetical protein
LDVKRWTFERLRQMSGCNDDRCGCAHEHDEHEHQSGNAQGGVANPAVIDMFGLDQKADEVLLVMTEDRPWDGSDERLHQVQEKFNAYVSFLLDGEMLAAHPELDGKRARIQLRCLDMPDNRAVELLGAIHDQLALQEIKMEVLVADPDGGGCGSGCTCH